MSRAIVVYESMFGNTERVARAVAEGVAAHLSLEAVEVGDATPQMTGTVDLLIVGAPTHAFGMSRASTRRDAAAQAHGTVVSQGIGVREWLEGLTPPAGASTAVFDTRVNKPRLPGSAAKAAARRLRRLGLRLACPPESFYVDGTAGPLIDGELDRARRWGERLAARVARGERSPR